MIRRLILNLIWSHHLRGYAIGFIGLRRVSIKDLIYSWLVGVARTELFNFQCYALNFVFESIFSVIIGVLL